MSTRAHIYWLYTSGTDLHVRDSGAGEYIEIVSYKVQTNERSGAIAKDSLQRTGERGERMVVVVVVVVVVGVGVVVVVGIGDAGV